MLRPLLYLARLLVPAQGLERGQLAFLGTALSNHAAKHDAVNNLGGYICHSAIPTLNEHP